VDRTISPALTVTPRSLEALTPEWQRLLHRAGNAWPFLRPSWLQVWLRTQAPETALLLLAVEDGLELAGIVPLLRRGERLQFAGDSEICDYMDVVAAPEAQVATLDAALRYLATQDWRELVLWGLRADSPTLAALPELAARHGLDLVLENEAVCPRVDLPPTWDDYLLTLSKKDRHELRRKMRRMAEVGGTIRDYDLSSAGEIEAAMPDFLRLHRESRQDKAEFMTPAMERFFLEMTSTLAQEDLVRLFFLEVDAQRVASVLAFNCGDELWLYNSGFDPAYAYASVGLVSKAIALQRAIEAGKRCYDFLRGAEPYKYDLGAKDLAVVRATLRRPEGEPAARVRDGR
jgi:CelD/BcsL family acetyltransferase involved in cellulose biosynthesis